MIIGSLLRLGNATLISYGLGMSSYTNDATPTLSLELRRRRFWASHLIMSFGSRVDFSATDYSPVFEKVPLPCSESLFEAGVTGPTGQLPDAQRDGSIYAELVRVITLWYVLPTHSIRYLYCWEKSLMSIRGWQERSVRHGEKTRHPAAGRLGIPPREAQSMVVSCARRFKISA